MRPELNSALQPQQFQDFYWLKEELIAFCRANSLSASGSKQILETRISHYLETGENTPPPKKQNVSADNAVINDSALSLSKKIPANYKNDESHRTFFKSVIGQHFKFNVAFMNWMKDNAGQTYQDAVHQWQTIEANKKSGKKQSIGAQFEYNQYIRDFFAENQKKYSRQEAIACWNYKKSQPGSNQYQTADLDILHKG